MKDRKDRSFFIKEDMDAFAALGQTFGGGDKDGQILNIDLSIDYIDRKTRRAYEKIF